MYDLDPVERIGHKLILRFHSQTDFRSELRPLIQRTRETRQLLWGPNAGCQTLHIEPQEEYPSVNNETLELSTSQMRAFAEVLEDLLRQEKPESVTITGPIGIDTTIDCSPVPLAVIDSILQHGSQMQSLLLTNILVDCRQTTSNRTRDNRSCLVEFHVTDCSVLQPAKEEELLAADSLISSVVKTCDSLQTLSIVSGYDNLYGDKKCWSSNPETVKTILQSGASSIALSSPNIQDEVLFNALPFKSDRLVELRWPIHKLSLSRAKAVADFLAQPSSLRKLTLDVKHMTTEDGTIIKIEDNRAYNEHSSVLLQICSILADALQHNQNLLTFHLDSAGTFGNTSKSHPLLGSSFRIFTKMLQNQYILEDVVFSTRAFDREPNMELYLKLNRHGRRHLMNGAPTKKWLDKLTCFNCSDDEDDLNCVFALLRMNPSLCSTTSK